LFISGADDSQQSVIAVRVSQSDFVTSSLAADTIILTVTMPPDYPHVAPSVSVSGTSLHRSSAEQLTAALAAEANSLVGQPMILDKCTYYSYYFVFPSFKMLRSTHVLISVVFLVLPLVREYIPNIILSIFFKRKF